MPRNHRRRRYKVTVTLSLLGTLYMLGCNRYVPSSRVIAKEELSTYNPLNFSKVSREKKIVKNEDQLIIKAIWYEQQRDYKRATAYYAKLYALTNRDEYLLKKFKTAFYTKESLANMKEMEHYFKKNASNLEVCRLLLSSYIKEKLFKKAKEIAQKLVLLSTLPIDYELASSPYLYTNEYQEAVNFLSKSYEKDPNEDVLINISILMGNYLNDIEGAVEKLEMHKRKRGCSERVCLQLVDVYNQQRKADKVITLYHDLYTLTGRDEYGKKLVDIYLYEKEYSKAISFLKTSYKNEALLYAIYIEKKEYEEAKKIAYRLLKKTKSPKWYAELAIVTYEGASDKKEKKMLQEVVDFFQKAMDNGIKNSLYLNYFGYILIENNIEVEKGLNIIKKALLVEPENSYYLDSLAWGYYKLNNCKEAYAIMKKVVKMEGLAEAELAEHWSAISRKCK